MNPIMKWIYTAYFNQDAISVVGIPENAKLASALQNMRNGAEFDMHNSYNVIRAHDFSTIGMALSLVRKYSTCKNL